MHPLLSQDYDDTRRITYLALDVPSFEEAKKQIDFFGDVLDGYKVGLELFYADGPRVLDYLAEREKRVFLDIKLHDIPNTVAGALSSIRRYPLEMVNVHAAGGLQMMTRARDVVSRFDNPPLLIAVTVLTSLSQLDLDQVGIQGDAGGAVLRLAKLAEQAGLDGVVASAWEAGAIREAAHPNFEIVVPGTRLLDSATHDQKRTQSPGTAVRSGASRLVLGRAVLQAADPKHALKAHWDNIHVELGKASVGEDGDVQ